MDNSSDGSTKSQNANEGFTAQTSTSPNLDVSINQEDPMAFQRCILFCFKANMPLSNIFKAVLCSFPSATYEDVKAWCYRFEVKNTNLRESIVSQVNGKTLTDLPAELLAHITNNVAVKDLKAVKNSCKTLQGVVPIDKVYLKIHLHLKLTSVELHKSGPTIGTECYTFSNLKKSLQDEDSKPSELSGFDYIVKAVEKLESIIEIPGVKVQQFNITVDKTRNIEMREKRNFFYQEIQKSWTQLGKLQHVEKFNVHVGSSIMLYNLLKGLKPETLTELKFESIKETVDMRFDMAEIVELPHWPHLKRIICTAMCSNISIRAFERMSFAFPNVERVTSEEVAYLKNRIIDNYLQNQENVWFFVKISHQCNQDEIIEKLKPFSPIGIEGIKGAIPCGNKKMLRFEINKSSITFEI